MTTQHLSPSNSRNLALVRPLGMHEQPSFGQNTQHGGVANVQTNTVTLGAATYIISRRFTEGQITKQDLLCGLLTQKLACGKSVDPNDAHEV